ncbi:hypothetical protein ABT104_11220 [Streptomyces mobaraensis]|uniref:hypothetical protein n=1 Tax=Streptomyces mobaraensis TaxID=35621 RepID=UPI003321936C
MTDDLPPQGRPRQRKQVLLRLDPLVHDALSRWAAEELRSANAQIEFLLRKALAEAGRLPRNVGAIRRPGRPAASEERQEEPRDGKRGTEGRG